LIFHVTQTHEDMVLILVLVKHLSIFRQIKAIFGLGLTSTHLHFLGSPTHHLLAQQVLIIRRFVQTLDRARNY
jgi:hypothetical protein